MYIFLTKSNLLDRNSCAISVKYDEINNENHRTFEINLF